ncbi:MAG TPA: hypothetical protein VIV34_07045, partial [Pseudolabrys sp.]
MMRTVLISVGACWAALGPTVTGKTIKKVKSGIPARGLRVFALGQISEKTRESAPFVEILVFDFAPEPSANGKFVQLMNCYW